MRIGGNSDLGTASVVVGTISGPLETGQWVKGRETGEWSQQKLHSLFRTLFLLESPLSALMLEITV